MTGVFTWKPRENWQGKDRTGLQAGGLNGAYLAINIRGCFYLCHRLAWLYVYGVWPEDQVDHKDRDKLNNKIANLVEASNRSNHANRPDNTSGHVGVIWEKSRQKWKAYARIDYVMYNIGRYDSMEEAVKARKVFLEKELCG